jgi:ABC-2 type transport system permease protein
MTVTATTATTTSRPLLPTPERVPISRVFFSLLGRDVYVTSRELPTFIAQVLLQPFFLVFVFGKVLAELGQTRPGYAQLLLPGVIALTSVLTGLQGTAFPLVIDFSFTREIEDRLLAPIPVELVAVEKVVFGVLRSLVAAVVMFPIGLLVLGHIPFDSTRIPLLLLTLLLGSIAGSTSSSRWC